MKKIFAIMLSLIFVISLSACGFGSGNSGNSDSNGNQKNRNNQDNIMSDSIISSQMSDTLNSSEKETLISRDRAIELVLAQEGIKKEDVTSFDADLEREAGNTYWEIEFDLGDYEYNYVIDAKTEKIMRNHKEPRD